MGISDIAIEGFNEFGGNSLILTGPHLFLTHIAYTTDISTGYTYDLYDLKNQSILSGVSGKLDFSKLVNIDTESDLKYYNFPLSNPAQTIIFSTGSPHQYHTNLGNWYTEEALWAYFRGGEAFTNISFPNKDEYIAGTMQVKTGAIPNLSFYDLLTYDTRTGEKILDFDMLPPGQSDIELSTQTFANSSSKLRIYAPADGTSSVTHLKITGNWERIDLTDITKGIDNPNLTIEIGKVCELVGPTHCSSLIINQARTINACQTLSIPSVTNIKQPPLEITYSFNSKPGIKKEIIGPENLLGSIQYLEESFQNLSNLPRKIVVQNPDTYISDCFYTGNSHKTLEIIVNDPGTIITNSISSQEQKLPNIRISIPTISATNEHKVIGTVTRRPPITDAEKKAERQIKRLQLANIQFSPGSSPGSRAQLVLMHSLISTLTDLEWYKLRGEIHKGVEQGTYYIILPDSTHIDLTSNETLKNITRENILEYISILIQKNDGEIGAFDLQV